jgi:hypothetical protein
MLILIRVKIILVLLRGDRHKANSTNRVMPFMFEATKVETMHCAS